MTSTSTLTLRMYHPIRALKGATNMQKPFLRPATTLEINSLPATRLRARGKDYRMDYPADKHLHFCMSNSNAVRISATRP